MRPYKALVLKAVLAIGALLVTYLYGASALPADAHAQPQLLATGPVTGCDECGVDD